jgi:RNA recognition motif-containing protein
MLAELHAFPYSPPMKNKPSSTVYISNLSYERDKNGLRRIFEKFGHVKNIKIIVEPKTNQSRGMAFIEMGSVKEAAEAIKELNGKVIDGRTAKLNYAIPQKEDFKRGDEEEEGPKGKAKPDFKSTQLAKKARNDARRKSNPLQFKAPSKKKTKG